MPSAEPRPRPTLFEHALRLHRLHPDGPLPHAGEPYPDEEDHRRSTADRHDDRRRAGTDVAAVLDEHFADPAARPERLADAFCGLHVPIHHNEHIAAAALRADRVRARTTGRWLVRRAHDRCAVTVGLALLATDRCKNDIPLIQTIGLLSNDFGALATSALRRRVQTAALLWLAERVRG